MIALASSGKRIPALALVGCLAGLATCGSVRLLDLLPEGFSESIGFIFGLFLCAYFWLFDETRSVWRTLGFVGASTLAYLRVEEDAVGFRFSLALSAVSSFVRV
jgi:hypothetical protein